jgi:hypothetical protein
MKDLLKVVSLVAAGVIVLVSTIAVPTPRVVRAVAATLGQNVDSPPPQPMDSKLRPGPYDVPFTELLHSRDGGL